MWVKVSFKKEGDIGYILFAMFKNRQEAGQRLADKLSYLQGTDAVIMAIPRGGVVVAAQIAKQLGLPLGLIIPRKMGAPGDPELAIGAVTGDGTTFLNENIIRALGISRIYIKREIDQQVEEIKRREHDYLQGREPVFVEGKTVIVVDDGLATGATAIASVRALRKKNPAKIILAVPVAPTESEELLGNEADEVVVLDIPPVFYAVGQFYERFEQTTDTEVKNLLAQIRY